MDDGITQQLREELAKLRQQLEETDLFKDIQALERIIRRRSKGFATVTTSEKPDRQVGPGRQEAITSVAMKDAAESYLRGKTAPVQTKDLFEALESQGITVPGDNPQNNLSAHLSRDSRFVSMGRNGWVLASSLEPQIGDVKLVAKQYVDSLTQETFEALRNDLTHSETIPATIDAEILRAARDFLGRNLIPTEKIEIRRAIAEAVDLRELIG